MKQMIFKTENSYAGLIARAFIGLILFPHGAQKALGWFGGYGFTGTMQFFSESVHLPWLVGAAVILIEFIGSLCLLLGLAGRVWALAVIGLMIGIIPQHTANGFFMNWFGNQKGEGFEYHLLMIALAFIVLIGGSGKMSIDRKLSV